MDCDLSPSQLKNLERAAGVPVLDRTGVIIEIFSRHARTRAARLQVEIARLNYLAPRLRETGGGSERQGGESAAKAPVRRVSSSISAESAIARKNSGRNWRRLGTSIRRAEPDGNMN